MNTYVELLQRLAFDASGLRSFSEAWLPVLLDAAAKGLVLLAVASALVLAMRKASAAARQTVWLLALAALIALPIASAALPSWGILPGWVKIEIAQPAERGQAISPLPNAGILPPTEMADPIRKADQADVHAALTPVAVSSKQAVAIEPSWRVDGDTASPALAAAKQATPANTWRLWVIPSAVAAWLAGAFVCLLPLVLGRISLWRLARRSGRIDISPAASNRLGTAERSGDGSGDGWGILLPRAAQAVGLRRPITLLQSSDETMPMVWGILRPKLLMPAEAGGWTLERRWVVLLHELAHARRRDCLAKLIAHVACSLYWFNPLCWIAFKLMQREAEAACDDLVLIECRDRALSLSKGGDDAFPAERRSQSGVDATALHGIRPSDYAQHLLEIATGLKSGMLAGYSSIAMARRSKLEGRLLAILDPRRNRRALTRLGLVIAAALIAAVAVPLACMKATSSNGSPERKTPAETAPQAALTVQEGVGYDGLKVGMSVQETLNLLGRPDERQDKPKVWLKYRRSRGLDLLFNDDQAIEIRFNKGFKPTLSRGPGIGSSSEEVFATYGHPIRAVVTTYDASVNYGDRVLCKVPLPHMTSKIEYTQQGVLFWFDSTGKVLQFVISRPDKMPSTQPASATTSSPATQAAIKPFEQTTIDVHDGKVRVQQDNTVFESARMIAGPPATQATTGLGAATAPAEQIFIEVHNGKLRFQTGKDVLEGDNLTLLGRGTQPAFRPAAPASRNGLPSSEPATSAPATQPTGKPSVGIYLITGWPKDVPFEKVPLADFTLEDKPLISERDIFEYEWESHTIRLKQQAVADNVLKIRTPPGGAFVVVVDGQRLYQGQLQSMASSAAYPVPQIHVRPGFPEQYQPAGTIRIHPPPKGTPDPRSDARLKQALQALYLLSRHDLDSKLEFRIAPKPSDLDKAELADNMGLLRQGKVGFWWLVHVDGRSVDFSSTKFKYAWLPFSGELTSLPGLVRGEYDGQKYVLVSDNPVQVMVSDEGKDSWGLARAYVTWDPFNQPAAGFELDDRGAELFAALTKANINNALAIVVDGKVVSVPIIRAVSGKQGMITGKFTRQEAADLAAALRAGMPPVPSASSGQASQPATAPPSATKPEEESARQFADRFLTLVRAGDKGVAELMTAEFDSQAWRLVVWRSWDDHANEMKAEFQTLRTQGLSALGDSAKDDWNHAVVSPVGTGETRARAVVRIGNRSLLLARRDGEWRVAGLFYSGSSMWGLDWLVDSAVTSPGNVWGDVLLLTFSKEVLDRAPVYVDLDTGKTSRPPQGPATFEWTKANGIDVALGAYGPRPPGVQYDPPKDTLAFDLRMSGDYRPCLITPAVAKTWVAERKAGSGSFAGAFIVQTREGTIGLLDVWSTGLKFIPLTQAGMKLASQSLNAYDTACLFLQATRNPISDKEAAKHLASAVSAPKFDTDAASCVVNDIAGMWNISPVAFQVLHATDHEALAITFPSAGSENNRNYVRALALRLSKPADKWLVDDVLRLENEQIQKAIKTFDEKRPPASASAQRPPDATDDYPRAVARLTRPVPHGQPTQLHKLLGDLHSQGRRLPSERELAAIKSLIADSTDIDARDTQGRSALHWAAWDAQLEIVKLLLANGADVNVMADKGWTPLHYAADATNEGQGVRNRVPEVVEILLKAGADPFVDIRPGELAGLRPIEMVNPKGRSLADVVRELQGGTSTATEVVRTIGLLWAAMEPGRRTAMAQARPVAEAFLRYVAERDADSVATTTWDQDIERAGQQKKDWKQVSDVIRTRYADKIERLMAIQEEQTDRGMAAFKVAPPEGSDQWLLVIVGRFSDGVWRVVMAEEKPKEMTLCQPLEHLVGTCGKRLLLESKHQAGWGAVMMRHPSRYVVAAPAASQTTAPSSQTMATGFASGCASLVRCSGRVQQKPAATLPHEPRPANVIYPLYEGIPIRVNGASESAEG